MGCSMEGPKKKNHRAKNGFPLWISWCLSNLSKVLDFWTLKNGILVLLRNATLTYPEEPSLKVEEDEEPFPKRAGALQSYHFRENLFHFWWNPGFEGIPIFVDTPNQICTPEAHDVEHTSSRISRDNFLWDPILMGCHHRRSLWNFYQHPRHFGYLIPHKS